ncbi:MAG: Fe-S-containing protein [Candidatus Binatus sp.]|uniref:Fe-S-containing protein n=1 Tax=Candidatus Binatus sp. TaxID=2811406 RepID=UPI0027269A97|nr:Fe-S-containing protein [Candidatus Binatus sp.]MDO8432012.1 Fe-S-containing protein [Candidatus Binatus sp.]
MRLLRFKIAAGAALAVGAIYLAVSATSNCSAVSGNGNVNVNIASLLRGHAKMFCYTDDAGKKLRFVLARGMDGEVRSVFDACRQCFTFHRGYQVVAGELICRVCGNHYAIDRMAEGKASCVPERLPHEGNAQTVKIKTSDLSAGRALF